jgi:hypothetical protein
MRAVVAIVVALAIVLLVVNGGESDVSGRDREAFEEGQAQALIAAPAVDPAPVITLVEEQGKNRLPPETATQLGDVRDLLTSAAGQSPEQAKPALEEAVGKLDSAIAQLDTAADQSANELTRLRLLHLQHALESVREAVATRIATS